VFGRPRDPASVVERWRDFEAIAGIVGAGYGAFVSFAGSVREGAKRAYDGAGALIGWWRGADAACITEGESEAQIAQREEQ